MSSLRQAPVIGRRALLLLAGLLLLAAIVIVFGGALTRSTDVETRAEQARAEFARVEEAVHAGEHELAFIETDAFFDWQGRAYGFGESNERPFVLEDAPPPAPITPIGPQDATGEQAAPFDAWMELLFGA